jgi:hypothetical protein
LEAELQASSDLEIPKEQWFNASDGLKTVRSLMKHLETKPDAVRDAALVLQQLAEFEGVLEKAEANGVRWHIAVDF